MGQDVVKFYLNKKRQPDSIEYNDEPTYIESIKADKVVIGNDWALTVNNNNELIITYKNGLIGKWIPNE